MPDQLPDPHQEHRCVLSDREAQVVRLLLTGYRVRAIGALIYLSPSTVRNHLSTAFRKLGVASQQELTLLFFELWREEGRRLPCSAARFYGGLGRSARPAARPGGAEHGRG